MQREPVEVSWRVNGLDMAGLRWGDDKLPPVLALHGWLDNAESFCQLAPLLEGYCVVAPDLTGHGRSSWRSGDANYQIWDDLPELMGIVTQMRWSEFNLLGHSRGAIISALLASAIPRRIRHLVLLDAVLPQAVPESNFSKQLSQFLNDKPRLLGRQSMLYDSLEAAIAARSAKGLSTASATALARRGVSQFDAGFRWNSDPRLQGASAVKLTPGQNRAIMQSLTMPTLLFQPKKGMIQHSGSRMEAVKKHIPCLQIEHVEGGHHFHMDAPGDGAAAMVSAFLST